MSWNPSHDQAQYGTARRLTRDHGPYWLVLWSPSNRAYYGFWRGPGHVGPIRYAAPDELARRMRHIRTATVAGLTS